MVIGYDDKGLPKTKNVLAKTKSECVEKLKTLKDALAPPAPPRIKADMPFGDWMEHWYETHSRPAARPGTRRIYEGYLRLYIRPGLGHIPLNRLTAKDMQQFFVWLKTEGRADQSDGETGLADSQLRNIHSLCRRALEQAVSENLIPRNPASGCKLPPARKGEMNVLSRESMQKLLIQAKEEKYRGVQRDNIIQHRDGQALFAVIRGVALLRFVCPTAGQGHRETQSYGQEHCDGSLFHSCFSFKKISYLTRCVVYRYH